MFGPDPLNPSLFRAHPRCDLEHMVNECSLMTAATLHYE